MKKLLPLNLRKGAAWFLIFLMITQLSGCRYFRVRQVENTDIATVLQIDDLQKYFVLHDRERTFALTDLEVDSTYLYANVAELSQPVYYSEDRKGKRYRKDEKPIIHEVHFYLAEEAPPIAMGTAQIPLQDIRRIDVIDHNSGATIASYVFTTIGIVLAVMTIITIIVALTKSSCPYVYTHNGTDFIFEGEIFGGAIMQNLERDDYLPLPSLQPQDGAYQLRITNELKERQYTNLAELIVINHGKEQKVLLDKYGNPQVIASEVLPESVASFGGEDLKDVLAATDQKVYFFNDEAYSQNGVVVKFPKPADAASGKLLLRGKNTLWFDYLFGKFTEKFGSRFDPWMEEQSKLPTEERLRRMIDSDIPLSVFVKIDHTWRPVDYLFTVGPLAARDFVIPVDLSEIAGKTVEIRIETGFLFWELDYVAMDFSQNEPLEIHRLSPTSAPGTGQKDWTEALAKTDKNYMAQLHAGEVAQLHYDLVDHAETASQSVFLHTRGYYELIREYSGLPKIAQLVKFRTPGYFSEFSRANYLKALAKEPYEPQLYGE